ncbi:hypothetical protein ACS0PU_012753 [Formica fusca]
MRNDEMRRCDWSAQVTLTQVTPHGEPALRVGRRDSRDLSREAVNYEFAYPVLRPKNKENHVKPVIFVISRIIRSPVQSYFFKKRVKIIFHKLTRKVHTRYSSWRIRCSWP